MSCYGLFLYEILPQYLLNPANSIYYFVFPFLASAFIIIYLPRILSQNINLTQSSILDENSLLVSDSSLLETLNPIEVTNNETSASQSVLSMGNTEMNALQEKSMKDDTAIRDIIDKKIEPVGNELLKIKDDASSLKEDVNTIKTSIDEMFSKFETAMIDLKSLQSELSNPLNSIQTNSESADYNKSSPLVYSVPFIESVQISPKSLRNEPISERDSNVDQRNSLSNQVNLERDELKQKSKNFQMFTDMDKSLTLGKLMDTIEFVGDIMKKLGNDSVNLLVEQCKLMGLNAQTQDMIHDIANMLNKSGMSVNDTLIMLYKFAQLSGITDKDADVHYIKLVTSKHHDASSKSIIKKE
ncbi:MAG: hypothetical protein HYR87_06450 [Thaumarchaeota archaeon]|nr:hypothetical protein [Nitrososphaerota archaeon]